MLLSLEYLKVVFPMSKKMKVVFCILLVLFLLSAGLAGYLLSGYGSWLTYTSYLQDPEQIYIMEAGIIRSLAEFRDWHALRS